MARVGTIVVSTSKALSARWQGFGTLQKAEEVSANATRTAPIWREDDLHDNEEEEEEEEELDSMSALLLTIGNLLSSRDPSSHNPRRAATPSATSAGGRGRGGRATGSPSRGARSRPLQSPRPLPRSPRSTRPRCRSARGRISLLWPPAGLCRRCCRCSVAQHRPGGRPQHLCLLRASWIRHFRAR